MKFETVLTSSKWAILEALAKGDLSMSEVARLTGTSLPNVSQQAKLLEAYELIRATKEERSSPGKPRILYSLSRPIAHVSMARRGFAGRKLVPLDAYHASMLSLLFLERAEDHYYLGKYLWQNEDLIKECLGLAVVDSRGDEIHLLVLAPPERLEHLRKRFSKTIVHAASGEKQRAVIAWTHSLDELRDGLAREDAYFRNLVKRLHIIIEKEEVFAEFMKR